MKLNHSQRRWLALFSGGLFIVTALSFNVEFNRPWKKYQSEFKETGYKLARAEYEKAMAEPGSHTEEHKKEVQLKRARAKAKMGDFANWPVEINQLYIPALQRVDRCTTCHLGIDDPLFKEAGQPFRSHPGGYLTAHPPDKFGCTICHRGQGPALTVEDAHGHAENWLQPMLPLENTQASCGACHQPGGNSTGERTLIGGRFLLHKDIELKGAARLSEGRKIFEDAGCLGCHQAAGYTIKEPLGPPLTHVGSKVDDQWLYRWLRNPKSYLPNSRMPDFALTDVEAKIAVTYFSTLKSKEKEREALDRIGRIEAAIGPEIIEKGKKLFDESQCVACHSISGKADSMGPDLFRVVMKVKKAWLFSWLKDPAYFFPKTRMPNYRFSDEEAAAITAYLFSEFKNSANGAGREKEPAVEFPVAYAAMLDKGKEILDKYGCAGCHEIAGLKKKNIIGPELTEIGIRRSDMLDFGKLPRPNGKGNGALPLWLNTKVKEPRAFSLGLKMPDFNFSNEQAAALTTFLLSLGSTEEMPRRFIMPSKNGAYLRPAGAFGKVADELKCFTCHSAKGIGGDLAPDLSREGSQVNKDWLVDFLMQPGQIRPAFGKKMPRFNMGRGEAEQIAEYISMVFVDDNIPSEIFKKGELTSQMVDNGAKLYTAKGCLACHKIGAVGAPIGPDLTKAGSRLKEGWIYNWIKEPKAYLPKTIMPDLKLSDAEARAITAYLLAQK